MGKRCLLLLGLALMGASPALAQEGTFTCTPPLPTTAGQTTACTTTVDTTATRSTVQTVDAPKVAP